MFLKLIIFLLFFLKECESDRITIPQSGCIFMFNTNPGGFAFLTCSTPTSANNNDWPQSIEECCPGQSSQDPPALNTLLSCKQKVAATPSLNIASIIIFSALAMIALTIFACFCGIIYKLLKSIHRNRVIQENEQNLAIQWENEQKNLSFDPFELKWCRKNKDKSKIIKESTCSICLQELPNAELYCKHIYHPECIGLWLKKSNFCPLCHREDIRSLKIYCQSCHLLYIICRKGFLFMNLDRINKKCCSCTQGIKEASLQVQQLEDMQYPPTQALIFELSSQHLASP